MKAGSSPEILPSCLYLAREQDGTPDIQLRYAGILPAYEIKFHQLTFGSGGSG